MNNKQNSEIAKNERILAPGSVRGFRNVSRNFACFIPHVLIVKKEN